ncbi:HAD-IIA family hydrolase [Methylacidiphilales bacterium]|nr:HAD-IIA family hydrolase [Candidatus Methylacidiphilales bacterium]
MLKWPLMSNKGYLLDMDGVIYRENQLIPGAAELVKTFQANYIPFLFLTNNSAPAPEDLVVKLHHLGISDLSPRYFYTSAMNTADFLAETHPRCTAFVVGEAGLTSALNNAKIANDNIAPTYVVIGEGTFSAEKLYKAHQLIEAGSRLVVTNPDNWCPVGEGKTRPGAGAVTAFLEASTGVRAYYLGKPNPYMFTQASKRLSAQCKRNLDEVIMVGDTMETDIRGAIECGIQAYLVLTGSTALEHMGDYVYQPTRVMDSIVDLLEEIKTGQPSDRRSSPAMTAIKRAGILKGKAGRRHQTDGQAFVSQRRRPHMTG